MSEVTPAQFWINNVTREEAQNTWKMINNQQEKIYVMEKLGRIL